MTRVRVVAAVGAIVATAVIAAALMATMVARTTGSDLVRAPFRLVCHVQVERSFEMAGTPMAICARCTGVYSGIALASLILFVASPSRRRRSWSVAGLTLMFPMVVDGLMQLFGIWSTGNLPRAVTGLLFGAGLIIVAINSIAAGRSEGLLTSEAS